MQTDVKRVATDHVEVTWVDHAGGKGVAVLKGETAEKDAQKFVKELKALDFSAKHQNRINRVLLGISATVAALAVNQLLHYFFQ